MKDERNQWFETFKKEQGLNSQTLLQFHKTAGKNNNEYGVIMNRGFVKTTSITQVEKTADSIEMIYENLINETVSKSQFNLPQIVND